jgi:hypothetical protein
MIRQCISHLYRAVIQGATGLQFSAPKFEVKSVVSFVSEIDEPKRIERINFAF